MDEDDVESELHEIRELVAIARSGMENREWESVDCCLSEATRRLDQLLGLEP